MALCLNFAGRVNVKMLWLGALVLEQIMLFKIPNLIREILNFPKNIGDFFDIFMKFEFFVQITHQFTEF